MKLTRERKIFLGVLLAAVGALVVDQLFLAPASVSAAPPLPGVTLAQTGPEAPAVESGSAGLVSMADLARRVRAFSPQEHEITNAFAFPESWGLDEPSGEPDADPRGRTSDQALRLTAVLPGPDGGVAVINGNTVRAGDPIAGTGYRLLRVGPGGVVVSDGRRAYQVPMNDALNVRPGQSGGPARDGARGTDGVSQAES